MLVAIFCAASHRLNSSLSLASKNKRSSVSSSGSTVSLTGQSLARCSARAWTDVFERERLREFRQTTHRRRLRRIERRLGVALARNLAENHVGAVGAEQPDGDGMSCGNFFSAAPLTSFVVGNVCVSVNAYVFASASYAPRAFNAGVPACEYHRLSFSMFVELASDMAAKKSSVVTACPS